MTPPDLDRTFALFLDVDGTLVEIAATPEAVVVAPGLPDLLIRLHQQLQGAVAIVSGSDPWHWLSISGRVVDIQPDTDLVFIDRMAEKYTGKSYQRRAPREVFSIEIDRVSPTGSRGRR